MPAPLGRVAVFRSYGALGISHILTGVDHLLFVLVILLVIRDGRTLIGAVTAFTVAHSISFGAAALGWIIVPALPSKPLLRFRSCFLRRTHAPFGARLQADRALSLDRGLRFRFASRAWLCKGAYRNRPSEGEVPLALVAFNIGVEIGQLLFILFVVTTGLLLRRLYPVIIGRSSRGGLLARGSSGMRLADWRDSGSSPALRRFDGSYLCTHPPRTRSARPKWIGRSLRLCCPNQVRAEASFPRQTCPTGCVTGMPGAVEPFRTATRTWNSAT